LNKEKSVIEVKEANLVVDLMNVRTVYLSWKDTVDKIDSHKFKTGHHFIAYANGIAAGSTTVVCVFDSVASCEWGLVENVFVLPKFRRMGVAAAMLSQIENDTKLWGLSYLKLTSRKPEAQALYRKLGWDEGCSFYKHLGGQR